MWLMQSIKKTLLLGGLVLLAAMLSVVYINVMSASGLLYSAKLIIASKENGWIVMTGNGNESITIPHSAPELTEEERTKAVEVALNHPMVVKLLGGKGYDYVVALSVLVAVKEERKNGHIDIIINTVKLVGVTIEIRLSDGSAYTIDVDPWKMEVTSIEDANTSRRLWP